MVSTSEDSGFPSLQTIAVGDVLLFWATEGDENTRYQIENCVWPAVVVSSMNQFIL